MTKKCRSRRKWASIALALVLLEGSVATFKRRMRKQDLHWLKVRPGCWMQSYSY